MSKKKKDVTDEDVDKSMQEMFMAILGHALLERTKHDPVLHAAVRKKLMKDLEKTDLYKEVIVRPSKEN
jgi:hypothetical protein